MGVKAGIPAWAVEKSKIVAPYHGESVKNAHKAGVAIAMGSDAGTPFNYHGKNLLEIPLLVKHGLSPVEALIAATSNAAQVLGMENQIGTIEPEKIADLVLVKHNPIKDIEIFNSAKSITLVMKGGELIENQL